MTSTKSRKKREEWLRSRGWHRSGALWIRRDMRGALPFPEACRVQWREDVLSGGNESA